jgi:hypothetical protein
VHIAWYDTAGVNHVDADIILHGVLMTAFNQNQDYHLA